MSYPKYLRHKSCGDQTVHLPHTLWDIAATTYTQGMRPAEAELVLCPGMFTTQRDESHIIRGEN